MKLLTGQTSESRSEFSKIHLNFFAFRIPEPTTLQGARYETLMIFQGVNWTSTVNKLGPAKY